jgi:hypothetical protein
MMGTAVEIKAWTMRRMDALVSRETLRGFLDEFSRCGQERIEAATPDARLWQRSNKPATDLIPFYCVCWKRKLLGSRSGSTCARQFRISVPMRKPHLVAATLQLGKLTLSAKDGLEMRAAPEAVYAIIRGG